MIRLLLSHIRRYSRREDGNMTIEFVIAVPLVLTVLLASIELGIYSFRHVLLDRGLDMAVRNIRLNTGAGYEHDDIKDMICDYSALLSDCDETLRLSMDKTEIRSFAGFTGAADCVDTSEDVQPVQTFTPGLAHELMVLRACYSFKPVFASSRINGLKFSTDGSGRAQMISVSVFAQEP